MRLSGHFSTFALALQFWPYSHVRILTESFRFWDEDDYKYEIFLLLGNAHAWASLILARKRYSRRHSTAGTSFSKNVVVLGTSYQM